MKNDIDSGEADEPPKTACKEHKKHNDEVKKENGTGIGAEAVIVKKSHSAQETEIPLYLIPQAIARWIRKKGDAIYRISIRRTHWHHYNVSVRTKAIPKELEPKPVVKISASRLTPSSGKSRKFTV